MSQAIEISQHAGKQKGITILRVKGQINSDTAPTFEKYLESMLAQGAQRIVVNLEDVDYVSSAGVGVFIGMLQRFREFENGDLKACKASPKLLKVFEAIGLIDVMDFLEDEAETKTWTAEPQVAEIVHHFAVAIPAEVFSGEEFEIRVQARDGQNQPAKDYNGRVDLKVSTGMIFPRELSGFQNGVVEGKVAITAAGTVDLTIADGKYEGRATLQLKAREQKAVFPQTVRCKTCSAEIVVKAADLYRCEECDETFQVDEWGHVFIIKPGSTAKRRKSKYKGVEMKINADVNYLGVIRTVISGLCQKEGMDDVLTNSVAVAIDEILLNLVEHGNDFDPWQILRIRMEFMKKQVKIQIRDFGDPYDVTKHKEQSIKSGVLKGSKRGVGGFLVNQLMDQVKYESTPTYNELTMIKYYGTGREKDK